MQLLCTFLSVRLKEFIPEHLINDAPLSLSLPPLKVKKKLLLGTEGEGEGRERGGEGGVK